MVGINQRLEDSPAPAGLHLADAEDRLLIIGFPPRARGATLSPSVFLVNQIRIPPRPRGYTESIGAFTDEVPDSPAPTGLHLTSDRRSRR